MASRRRQTPSATARSRRSSEPKPITDEDVEDAVRVLRAHYYQEVRSYADDILAAVKSGEITNDEQLRERITQDVDGSARVIYTYKSRLGLLVSDNDDAYEEEFGEPTNDVAAQMSMAMQRDVSEAIGEVDFDDE